MHTCVSYNVQYADVHTLCMSVCVHALLMATCPLTGKETLAFLKVLLIPVFCFSQKDFGLITSTWRMCSAKVSCEGGVGEGGGGEWRGRGGEGGRERGGVEREGEKGCREGNG